MAISKTTQITSITYTPEVEVPIKEGACVWVNKTIIIDDPDDDELPMVKHTTQRFFADSDVSLEDALVVDIFNAVFGIK